MPLQTSRESQAERDSIEQEWQTERSYAIANLTTARRAGLTFVKATKTDEEWTRASREGLDAGLFNKLKTSKEIAKQNADWYRELVGRSGSNGSGTSTPIEGPPIQSTSRVTVELQQQQQLVAQQIVTGEGSKDVPFMLDDDDEDEEQEEEEQVQSSSTAVTVNAVPPDPTPALFDPGDMFCLLCKTLVPSPDVRGHTSSILHQLSKDPLINLSVPLVPPTYYHLRPSSNIGYSMLQRLGWEEDTALGRTEGKGRKTPVRAVEKYDRKGLGVDSRKRTVLLREEEEGKVVKSSKEEPGKRKEARPLAKSRKDLERSKLREMQAFKEGLAYLNS